MSAVTMVPSWRCTDPICPLPTVPERTEPLARAPEPMAPERTRVLASKYPCISTLPVQLSIMHLFDKTHQEFLRDMGSRFLRNRKRSRTLFTRLLAISSIFITLFLHDRGLASHNQLDSHDTCRLACP